MMKVVFALDGMESIKDKRNIVRSARERLIKRFHLSAAETDLQDSLSFAEVSAALVSNDKNFGEKALQKAFVMLENEIPARVQDVSFYSEVY